MFENEKVLITGGTGSFGKTMLKKLLETKVKNIVILSRDEKKQNDLRDEFIDSRINFVVADIREKDSIMRFFKDIDMVFHAAALKQVPSCELYPLEAIKTNIIGTNNVLDSAIENNVKNVVCLSTDKAVQPVNVMGLTKSMMEKIALSKSQENHNTIISITRYGNVLSSRGSVVPLFISQATKNVALTLTDELMSRFIMTLEEAIDLVLFASKNSKRGDIFVKKSHSCYIKDLAESIIRITKSDSSIIVTGIRPGEKRHETLVSQEEMAVAIDMGEYFRIPSKSYNLNFQNNLNYSYSEIENYAEFNSLNTKILNKSELDKLITLTIQNNGQFI